MADQADESRTGSDKAMRPAEQLADDDAVTTLMEEVWDRLSTLGIGPRADIPLESTSLPPVEVLDPSAAVEVAPVPLEAPLKLPPPPTRIATEDVTMDIYPDVDPKKKEVTINVKGEF